MLRIWLLLPACHFHQMCISLLPPIPNPTVALSLIQLLCLSFLYELPSLYYVHMTGEMSKPGTRGGIIWAGNITLHGTKCSPLVDEGLPIIPNIYKKLHKTPYGLLNKFQ